MNNGRGQMITLHGSPFGFLKDIQIFICVKKMSWLPKIYISSCTHI